MNIHWYQKVEKQKIAHGISQDKEKLHIQMVILMKVDSKKVLEMVMALILILKKEQKKQKTLTLVNGKKTKKTELASKFTQESVVIKDIGKTACETVRVL